MFNFADVSEAIKDIREGAAVAKALGDAQLVELRAIRAALEVLAVHLKPIERNATDE